MSIHFSKLYIQNLLSHRGSTYGQDQIPSEDEEESWHGDDDEYYEGDEQDDSEATIEPPVAKVTQRQRLTEAFRDLQQALERQTELQSLLSARLRNEETLDVTGLGVGIEVVRPKRPVSLYTERDELPWQQQGKLRGSRKTEMLHESLDGKRRRIASTEDLLAFRKCERLSKKKERVEVEVRVVFLKIGEIDTLKEIYHADVFIQAKWKESRLQGKTDEELRRIDLQKCWNPLVLIDNILSESKEHHWMLTHRTEDGAVYIVERRRLRGIFLETLELNDFPLDVQDLTVTLTSERPDSEVLLVPDKTEYCGINLQTFVDQQEWRLHEHIEVTMRSTAQEYTNMTQCHPCISVTCRAARRPGYFYWNVFLIMFFITGLSFATFAVPPERPENRLQLSFTLFLTSVAFKFVINQSLPKISYLTYMDKYVLMSLAILCVVSIWHAVVAIMPIEMGFESGGSNSTSGSSMNFSHNPEIIRTQNVSSLMNVLTDNVPMIPRINQTANANSQDQSTSEPDPAQSEDRTGRMLSMRHYNEVARQSMNRERQRVKIRHYIEQEVFTSFCVLYVLAHLTFIFWLYFDASRRRREMVEKDKIFKRFIQASKKAQTDRKNVTSN